MHKIKNINLPENTLEIWLENFLNPMEIYYFDDYELVFKMREIIIIVLDKKEMKNNPAFFNIDTWSRYHTWDMDRKVKLYAIVNAELPQKLRQEIYLKQWELKRGQIYSIEMIENLFPEKQIRDLFRQNLFTCTDGEKILLDYYLWQKLPREAKIKFICAVAEEYIDYQPFLHEQPELREKLIKQFPFISNYFDSFPENNGANCFAAALAAISPEKQAKIIIQQWFQFDSFKNGVQLNNYSSWSGRNENKFKKGDILVWLNDFNAFHAAYYLGDNLLFNKDGQTRFHPWMVITLDQLKKSWKGIINRKTDCWIWR